MEGTRRKHFLIVTYPAQGHINPAIHLANNLANSAGSRVTFSTAVSGHGKMFPGLASPDEEVADDGGSPVAYVPFCDGHVEGFKNGVDDLNDYLLQSKYVGSQSLSSIIDRLDSRGQRVDCVVYTFIVSWAAEVARDHGIPSAQYWIQPATVFAIYYHAFHGYDELISAHCKDPLSTVELPCLPPLCIRDLPSFLTATNDPYSAVMKATVKEAFVTLDREQMRSDQKQKVLVNSCDELEADALSAVDNLDLIAVGPVLPSFPKDDEAKASSGFNLFKPDEKRYMEWLDSQPEKSVVYVSFGSVAVLKKRQMEEIAKGLKGSGRPYLWVVRSDCKLEGEEAEAEAEAENGMVVEWCSQVRVLKHPSVGCFVTHCGWNSTTESLVFGVPTVGVPQWADQGTNLMLMEKGWGTGVRSEINEDGVLEGEELRRCLDLIMGKGRRGREIRRSAEAWSEKATEAIREGGTSDRNLRAFVDGIVKSD